MILDLVTPTPVPWHYVLALGLLWLVGIAVLILFLRGAREGDDE